MGPRRIFLTVALCDLLYVLASAAETRFVDPVRDLRESPSVSERLVAAGEVVRLAAAGNAAAIAALAAAIRADPSEEVRVAAVRGLAALPGCSSEEVKEALQAGLRDPASAVRQAAAETGAKLECGREAKPPPASPRSRSGLDRLFFGATAHAVRQGTASFVATDVGGWAFSYAYTDDTLVSVQSSVPFGAFSLFPSLRFSAGDDSLRYGVVFQGGTLLPYLDVPRVWLAGGGALVTFGGRELFGNFAVYGFAAGDANRREGMVLVNFGGNLSFGGGLLNFLLEGWLCMLPDTREASVVGAFLYGIRFAGAHAFGDLGFGIPLYSKAGEILRVLPMGIPMLNFGYTW
jgi:hypothetical protein